MSNTHLSKVAMENSTAGCVPVFHCFTVAAVIKTFSWPHNYCHHCCCLYLHSRRKYTRTAMCGKYSTQTTHPRLMGHYSICFMLWDWSWSSPRLHHILTWQQNLKMRSVPIVPVRTSLMHTEYTKLVGERVMRFLVYHKTDLQHWTIAACENTVRMIFTSLSREGFPELFYTVTITLCMLQGNSSIITPPNKHQTKEHQLQYSSKKIKWVPVANNSTAQYSTGSWTY